MVNGNGNGNDKRITADDLKSADTEALCDELLDRLQYGPGDDPVAVKREIMKRAGYVRDDNWRKTEKQGKKDRRRDREVMRDRQGNVIVNEDDEDDEDDDF
jgi:hypothetical protein